MKKVTDQLAGLLSGALLAGCMGTTQVSPPETVTGQFSFSPYEVVISAAERQTILAGFLLSSSSAELAVLSVDEHQQRRLQIYAFESDNWLPKLDATLQPDVMFVDVANISGRDRLIMYAPGRVNWFEPDTATEHALAAVRSNFTPPRQAEIPHVDITRDINGDGLDDLVIPQADGFAVFVQLTGGTFSEPVKIGPPSDISGIYGADGYRYDPWSQSRIFEADINLDGRDDLVFWKEDRFEVHAQDERGLTPTATASRKRQSPDATSACGVSDHKTAQHDRQRVRRAQ